MGPPRRETTRNRHPAPSQQPQQSGMGMSPMSRYNHNLKVLRRRDPSIISIFDQFSHVCVYHHNGKKWEKQGFEGSMFLYERDSYPPYGFYILNRMGMKDYIHRLCPEDDIHAHGSYLMIRSYPDFTSERLNAVLSSHNTPPEKFADAYAVPNLDKLGHNDKGRSQTVGLWMFATDAREPMIDVMLRLHSHIKQNLPYPEEFRYGPGNPPPPNPHPHTSTASHRAGASSSQSFNGSQSYESTSENESITSSEIIRSSPGDGPSDLDKLFLKLQSMPASSSLNAVSTKTNHHLSSSSSAIPPVSQSTSTMTVDSLFAALSGTDQTPTPTQIPTHASTTLQRPLSSNASTTLQRPLPPNASTTPQRPLSSNASPSPNAKATTLLNTIFASATPINDTDVEPDNDDDREIIELDFEETSVLSDMNAFKKAAQTKKGKEKSRGTCGGPVARVNNKNGKLSGGIPGNEVDSGLVKDTLISTLLRQPQKPGKLERNAFVREVLTLIHTDNAFVDTLWKGYMNKLDA